MRTVLVSAAIFAALGATAPLAAAQTAMFRANAAHTGVYLSTPPALRAVKWRFHAGEKIISSPAVSAGIVYVGSADGYVYAVRAADGRLLWKHATNGAVNSSPAVWNGTVFASSLDGNVYALDAATGAQRWRFGTQGERRFTAPGIHGMIPSTELMADPWDTFLSSPAVADGTVCIGSGDHNVYALDAATGQLRWKFATGNVVHASPAVWNASVYVGSWDRYFYALDARTGSVRWKYLTGDDRKIYNQVGISSSAAIANGIVYFGCRDSHLYALDARTGAVRWVHNEHGSWVVASPAIARGAVYFTTSDSHSFYALDARTGMQRFRTRFDIFSYSSPSIAGHVAYYGSFDGMLYATDIMTGKVLARFVTDGNRTNRHLYVTAKGGMDFARAFPDGTLDGTIVGIQHLFELGAIPGSPAIADGVLYVGSGDGTLYAIE